MGPLPLEAQTAAGTALSGTILFLVREWVKERAENKRLNAKIEGLTHDILDERERLLTEVKTERDQRMSELKGSAEVLAQSNQSLAALTQALIARRDSKPPTVNG